MKKSFLTLLFAVVIFLDYSYAVPAKPTPMTVSLPDGTTLTVRLFGDESSHYYTTLDHYLLIQDQNGYFYYAESIQENKLQQSPYRVKDISKRTPEENKFLATIDKKQLLSLQQQQDSKKLQKMPSRRVVQKATYPTTGTQKGLVILVEYSNNKFTINNPQEAFNKLLNEKDYSENGGTGSARDFFMASSNDQFKPEFDVYGPVKLSRPMSYYGGNDISGNDKAPEEMVIEACQLLDDEIDFTEYDRDNDGQIDNVYVFYAGYGEATGGGANTVWPHSWDIYDGAGKTVMLDGIQLNHYACSNELDTGNNMTGIGTFCHEFSHVLGLPDLYATTYTYSFTPGSWSLMDSGSYNNDSRTPPYLSVYERYALGWLTPKEIGDPANIKLDNISKNTGYIIKTYNENEYFLLENRQQEGWDKYIPGHGMLIWHIDYNETVWNRNVVNNTPSHQYVDIEEADNKQTETTRAGDTFPGTKKITSFTDDTSPNMRTWKGIKQDKPITEIEEKNGIIYFKISGGKEDLPTTKALPATDITPSSFIAHWEKSEIATSYAIDVYTINETSSGKITMNYVDGYQENNVGNVESCLVEGLEPATEYRYVIRVYDETGESPTSNEIIVITDDPTFDFLAPKALEATAIKTTSFEAQWEAMEEAQNYLLYVYTKELGDPLSTTIDFTGGITELPTGWKTNCKSTYGSANNSGKAIPSLRFSQDYNYIESPVMEENIRNISFWYRGIDADEESQIILSGYVNKNWIGLDTISPSSNKEGGILAEWKEHTAKAIPNGCKAMRITYKMVGTGSLAVDDITIDYGGEVFILPLKGYEGKEVGNTVSWLVEQLESEKEYFYAVTAFNGEVYSKKSNEIAVSTLSDIMGIKPTSDNGISVYMENSELIVTSDNPDLSSLYILDVQGHILEKKTITLGTYRFPITDRGIYIVRIGSRTYKVIR